ncbi:MAG: hypothetical protein PVS2B1_21860 [Candidatus Dormibacteraceae bacterium]
MLSHQLAISAGGRRLATLAGLLIIRHTVAAASPIVTISGLSKTYASGLQALKGINLSIEHGEILALLGPNGAG